MAKKQLKLENVFDFMLLGILCQHKDYRLCNAINTALGLHLKRVDDLDLHNSKTNEHAAFSLYEHEDEDLRQYYVLSNRDGNGRFLLPEEQKMDYFVLLKGGFSKEETEEVRQQLKTISIVLGAYEIDVQQLKSKETLLF